MDTPRLAHLGNAAARARFRLRRRLLDSPHVGDLYLSHRRTYRHRVIREGTEIVADGFPRSANSYFRQAFMLAQGRDDVLAGHAHSAALLNSAVKRGFPTVLILRAPGPVCASYLQYEPWLSPRDVVDSYIAFHEALIGSRANLLVAEFSAVTSDMATVIESINDRFGTRFSTYVKSTENEELIRERLEQISRTKYGGEIAEHRVSRPSALRTARSNVIDGFSTRDRERLAHAHALYADLSTHR